MKKVKKFIIAFLAVFIILSAGTGYYILKLYDGARLLVTVGKTVARTGEVFCGDPISPDVECDDPRQEAVNWILRQG